MRSRRQEVTEKRGELYATVRGNVDESAARIRQQSESLNGPRDGVELEVCINTINTFLSTNDEDKIEEMDMQTNLEFDFWSG